MAHDIPARKRTTRTSFAELRSSCSCWASAIADDKEEETKEREDEGYIGTLRLMDLMVVIQRPGRRRDWAIRPSDDDGTRWGNASDTVVTRIKSFWNRAADPEKGRKGI